MDLTAVLMASSLVLIVLLVIMILLLVTKPKKSAKEHHVSDEDVATLKNHINGGDTGALKPAKIKKRNR